MSSAHPGPPPADAPAPGPGGSGASPAGRARSDRRRASTIVVLGATALVAGAMLDHRPEPQFQESSGDYAQVCRDETTQERLPDEDCEDDGSGSGTTATGGHAHGWYFIPLSGGRTVPAVGQPVTSGLTSRPGGTGTRVPAGGGDFAKSGTVSKGGFGSKGGGAGS